MRINLLAKDLGVSPRYILSLFPQGHSTTDLTSEEASYVIHKTIEEKQHLPPNFDFDKYLAGEMTLSGEALENNKNNHSQVSNNVVSDTNNSLQKPANVILIKCDNCSEEFRIYKTKRKIKYCPFCAYEFIEKEPTSFSDISSCFKYLVSKFSVDIFSDSKKLLSYVSDYLPTLTVEKRILKIALESGIYKTMIDKSGNVIQLNVDKSKYVLVNEYGLSEKWALDAVNWLVMAIEDDESVCENELIVEEEKPKEIQTETYTYVGDVDQYGVPNGHGHIKYITGEEFIGCFVNGRLEGHGTWITKDGKTFEGNFKGGVQQECEGVLTEKNGCVYVGHFRKGLRKHGYMKVTINGYTFKENYDNNHKK